MLQPLHLLCLLAVAQVAAPVPKSQELMRDLRQAETDLLTALKARSLWEDPAQETNMLQQLQLARVVKAESLIPILVEHINYIPPSFRHGISTKGMFPSLEVLDEIGLPVVPHLLELLKKTDPAEFDTADFRDRKAFLASIKGKGLTSRSRLAILCLIGIYDKAEFGPSLAKRRIELELPAARGTEKLALEKLLLHRFSKD